MATPDTAIVNEGNKIILPSSGPGSDIPGAIKILAREHDRLEEWLNLDTVIEGVPNDVAHAAGLAMKEEFGYVSAKRDAFGQTHNAAVEVPVSTTETVTVPWGRFEVPGVDGYFEFGTAPDSLGRHKFHLGGRVKRRSEARVKRLIELTKQFLKTHSILRGRAFAARFYRESAFGREALPMPDLRFIDPNPNLREEQIFDQATQDLIDINLYTPIEHTDTCRAWGIPLKRGVLLHGEYGTGKSMSMAVAEALAVLHGWTFIKVERADELADAMKMAADYQPCIVSCEDIDAVTAGERSIGLNDILNTLDGIESKDTEIITVLTTNHLERINPAMLRAGRLDATIEVRKPDAVAATRLLAKYGRGLTDGNEAEAGLLMANNNAGDIREVAERSKLTVIRRDPTALPTPGAISGKDLALTAQLMQAELDLRRPKPGDNRTPYERGMDKVAEAIASVGSVQPQLLAAAPAAAVVSHGKTAYHSASREAVPAIMQMNAGADDDLTDDEADYVEAV